MQPRQLLVPPSGSRDSVVREGTKVVCARLLSGNKTGVESAAPWHDESEAERGSRDALAGRRSGDCFACGPRSAGSAGASPFDLTTVGVASSHDFACRRQYWRPRERAGTRRVAEDGAVLARTVAAGACRPIRVGAARRCAALGRACDIHPRTDLRGDRDDLREAVGERAADQPLEPARNRPPRHFRWRGLEATPWQLDQRGGYRGVRALAHLRELRNLHRWRRRSGSRTPRRREPTAAAAGAQLHFFYEGP